VERRILKEKVKSNRAQQLQQPAKPAAPAPKGKARSQSAKRPKGDRKGGGKGGRPKTPGRDASVPRAPDNVCFDFWKTGTCARGLDCKWDHKRPGNRDKSAGHTPRKGGPKGKAKGKGRERSTDTSNLPCRNWTERGTCEYGKSCKFSHNGPKGSQAAPAKEAKPKAQAKAAAPAEPAGKKRGRSRTKRQQ
jgi:hypothetical protein